VKIDFHQYLEDLERVPADRGAAAFFDLDRTLIAGYSLTALALERLRSGAVSPRKMVSHAGVFLGWGLRRAGYHELVQGTVRGLVGLPEEEIVALGEQAFERRLSSTIYEEARRLIEAHRALGHEVVMVTSATRYQAEPVARELNVPHLFCTELEIADGRIAGGVELCHGEGKKRAAVAFARDRASALADAYFYTDSAEDLPLLEAVGRPVTANAKTALARVAIERGWPQLTFASLGTTKGMAA